MSKKIITLISLIFVLLMISSASAVTYWDNDSADQKWETTSNWDGNLGPGNDPAVDLSGTDTCIIGSGVNANEATGTVYVGYASGYTGSLSVNGGTLTAGLRLVPGYSGTGTVSISSGSIIADSSGIIIGWNSGSNGQLNISGGTVSAQCAGGIRCGNNGTGTITISNGQIITDKLTVPYSTSGTGHIDLDGGTIEITTSNFSMSTHGTLDVTAGTLIIAGDVVSTIDGYINDGKITGYGGPGTLNLNYNVTNAGKTTLTATPRDPFTYVADYGAYPNDGIDDTAAINSAIDAAYTGDTVVFEAGTYDLITPFDSLRFIKASYIHNITLQGATSGGDPATKLLRHVAVENRIDPPRTVYFFAGSDVTFENFILDNNPRLSTAGEVVYKSSTTVRVKIFDGLPMESNTSCYSANAWLPTSPPVLKEVPSLTSGTGTSGSPANWTIYDQSNRIMQLYKSTGLSFTNDLSVGDYMSWHYGNSGKEQLYVYKTNGIALRNLKVPNTINVFSVIGAANDVTLEKISLKSEDNQLAVGPRDGFHMSRCTGIMDVNDLVIDAVRMDGFVVRTPFAEITSKTDATHFRILTEISVYGQPIASGSTVRFFDSYGDIYDRVVSSATYVSDYGNGSYYDIVTTTDVPAFAVVGTCVTLGGLTPDSISIKNSSFKDIAGSALVLLAGDITVDNVTCTRMMYPAIHIGANTGTGACGSNITVQNSTFDNCGWDPGYETFLEGVITVANTHTTYTEAKVHTVSINDNTFLNQLYAFPAIGVWDTDTIDISGNFFENAYLGLQIDTNTTSYYSVYGTEVVTDNSDNSVTYTEVSGTFRDSSLTGYNGSSSRYSGTPGAKAKWTFNCPKTANYDVYIYKIQYANSDSNAKITTTYSGGTDVDYIDYTSGSSGWVYLGTHSFAGQNTYEITNERSNGNLRADAVMFVQQ